MSSKPAAAAAAASTSPATSAVMASSASGVLGVLRKQAEKNRKLLHERDASGKTPLHYAATSGHLSVCQFLVDQGVDINATDSDGWTPLHCACNDSHLHVAQYLLSNKANVHLLTSQGGSALHYAVRAHRNNAFLFLSLLAQFLTTIGFNINTENHFGETPLHSAVMRNNTLATAWLINQNADLNVPNKKRMTPLAMATMVGHVSLVKMLLYRGAKTNVKSDNGTAQEIAASINNAEILALLKAAEAGQRPKTCPEWDEMTALFSAFGECTARGMTAFDPKRPFMAVLHARTTRFLPIDVNVPVSDLVRHLESLFGRAPSDELMLFLQSPKPITQRGMRSPCFAVALVDAKSLSAQMPQDYSDEMPTHYWLSLKPRKRLLRDDQLLNAIAAACELDEFDRMGKALVTVFEASGMSDQLLKWAIGLELKNTEESGTMFREDSLTTKIITHYLRIIGRGYLHTMLGATIRSISTSHQSYEVDPNRPDAKKSNSNKVKKLVKSFLQSIFKSLDYAPYQVWQLTHQIRDVVAARHPDAALGAVSAFLFLRFICPVITSPHAHGIVDEPPTPEASRALILAAKVMQNLANGVLFGDKEQYLLDMNKLITSKQTEFKQFLNTLSTGEVPAVAPPGAIEIDHTVEDDGERLLEQFLIDKNLK